MLDPFYESVQFSVNGLEQMTSQGGSTYQLVFDAKAYKNSEAYKTQQQIDKVASGYVEGKVEQKQEIKQKKQPLKPKSNDKFKLINHGMKKDWTLQENLLDTMIISEP